MKFTLHKCAPKVIPKVIHRPSKKIKCCNCGCPVPEGTCHCGATNQWAFDSSDGWYQTGSIPHFVCPEP